MIVSLIGQAANVAFARYFPALFWPIEKSLITALSEATVQKVELIPGAGAWRGSVLLVFWGTVKNI
jgi:hypothetical protein